MRRGETEFRPSFGGHAHEMECKHAVGASAEAHERAHDPLAAQCAAQFCGQTLQAPEARIGHIGRFIYIGHLSGHGVWEILKRIRKRVRPSGSVRSEKRALCRCRISEVIVSPIPCPSGFVEKKGLKRLAEAEGDMPQPLSATVRIAS